MWNILDSAIRGKDWRKCPKSERQKQNEELVEQIRLVHCDSRQSYGSPRTHMELQEQGRKCSRKRVARLMRVHGVSAQHKRRRICTTDSPITNPVADNRLNREFSATEANTKWAGDLISTETAQSWL
jgi:transposase InsO family protein